MGQGKGRTVLQLIKAFEKVTKQKLKYEIGPKRPGDVEAIYANVEKSKKILDWETELTMEDALKDAFNWQKSLKNDK